MAADEIRFACFYKYFDVKKINELVVTGNKLINNFSFVATSCHGLDVARRPPVGPQ
jgi:hypothetical protein